MSPFYVSTGALGRKTYVFESHLTPVSCFRNPTEKKSAFLQTITESLSKLHSMCPAEHFQQKKASRKIFSLAETHIFE